MLMNWDIFKQDVLNYKNWLIRKTVSYDKILLALLYGGFGILFIYGTLKVNAAVGDLFFGSFLVILWTVNLIPIPWIAEQINISRYKTISKKEIRIILRTRLFEQFILVECFQVFFMALALLGNVIHPNPITTGYSFNILAFRIIGYFLLMIGMEWFFLVFATYIGFHNMNYLRFIYFDLIPNKRPLNVSPSEFREVFSKLKKPYQFNVGLLGLMSFLLIFFMVIYCIPVSFYMLFLGNFPPLSSLPDASGDLLVMKYTPFIILLLNAFFLIGGLIFWSKLPYAIQTISEELYTIPNTYLDILLRLKSTNQSIISELKNSTNTYSQNIFSKLGQLDKNH